MLASFCFFSETWAGTNFLSVPLDGNWVPEKMHVKIKDVVSVSLQLTPTTYIEKMSVSMKIPEGVKLISGNREYHFVKLKANKHIEIKLSVSTNSTEELRIFASAVVVDEPGLKLVKPFLLTLNPKKSEEVKGIRTKDSKGNKVIIY